jgi:hypothetical protein
MFKIPEKRFERLDKMPDILPAFCPANIVMMISDLGWNGDRHRADD